LTWSASTDNVGVAGYRIYRNGSVAPVATVTGSTYQDTGLSANTTYSYTVAAYDAVGNVSAQSKAASATTPGVSNIPPTSASGSGSSATSTVFQMHADASEVSGVTNGSAITPALAPSGMSGTVVVNGAGSVNYAPAQSGNGVYFL